MTRLPVFSILFCLQMVAADSLTSDPATVLARTRSVMGFSEVRGRILHVHSATAAEQPHQSDRTYPPFFSMMGVQESWLNVETRVQRLQQRDVYPGAGPTQEVVTIDDGMHASVVRGGRATPIHRRRADSRNLDPWAVIADWSAATDVRAAGLEMYRDYPRVVLVRRTAEGLQRLFVDPKSGFPVKLDLVEPHYLWGQQHVEYLWSTWVTDEGVSYPGAAFRVVDGRVEYSRTNGDCEILAPAAAPTLAAPAPPAQPPADLPLFLQPLPPSAVKVTGSVWLLSNPGYNEVVAEAGGEVFLFDSTQGEVRARQDADLIRKLFPRARKVNVVVTDLAWPHVAGVRYWVAEGATIISHGASREFLQRVVDRRWIDAPDLLERKRLQDRGSVRFDFVPIDRATDLAQGHVRLIPIDGVASEVALMAYLPQQQFLWASDFIQTLESPSRYAREVIDAAERDGIRPERVAAEHLPITMWSEVLKAQASVISR